MWYEDKTGIWHRKKECPDLMKRGHARMGQKPGWKICRSCHSLKPSQVQKTCSSVIDYW